MTPNDEYKRYRRRERNKVAATKCRNKKKEKHVKLIKVSHIDTRKSKRELIRKIIRN